MRSPVAVWLLLSSSLALASPKAAVIKRVFVSQSRPSGTLVTTVAADGAIHAVYDVVENGRGPHVDANYRLAPDGTIASFSATGHREMGTKVDETFERKGNHAHWKSTEEAGDRELGGRAFFVPNSDTPDAAGMMVRAALAAGGSLPLLPAGELRVEKVAEVTVKAGAQSKKLIGYALVGLELLPTYTWMNEDGSWFGKANPWSSIVPEGWEAAIEPLIARQDQLRRERDAKLARELEHRPPAAGLAYRHARVLDVEHGKWLADQTVIVVGDVISSVGPSAAAKIPKGAEIVDLTGRALQPGLFDMHSHLYGADGILDLASGVTTARDVGNDPDKLDEYEKRYDDGSAIGPHVLKFGFIEGRNPKAAASKVTAETEKEAKDAVAFYLARHYQGVKIYNSVRPELVPIIAKEAHAHGLGVTGHIPVHMLANEAVRAGYDGIEHVNMLFLNFFATHDTDTRDTTRFTLVGDKAASFDLASQPVRDFLALLKEHKTVIDPTVDAFEDLLVGEPGKVIPGLENVVERLPVMTQRDFLVGGLPIGDKRDLYRASFGKLLAMVKALYDAHITLVVGTDALGGLMLHHEMALYARAGIPPASILKMATIDAARTLGLDGKTGSIAAGKRADLAVVDGDPLAHIADAGNVISTMRGGVVFQSAALYQSVGVRPYTPKR